MESWPAIIRAMCIQRIIKRTVEGTVNFEPPTNFITAHDCKRNYVSFQWKIELLDKLQYQHNIRNILSKYKLGNTNKGTDRNCK